MKKYIFPILVSVLLFYPLQGFEEVKEIISEGTYNMGDGETPPWVDKQISPPEG